MVDVFNKSEFEAALPVHKESGCPLWESLGLIDGEHCYVIGINELAAIMVRSSIDSSGISADCGEDSIRMWLVEPGTLKPAGSKISRWTTRVPGWQIRVKERLHDLYFFALKYIRKCPCGGTVQIFKVKKEGTYKNMLFTSCSHFGCQISRFSLLPPEWQPTSALSSKGK